MSSQVKRGGKVWKAVVGVISTVIDHRRPVRRPAGTDGIGPLGRLRLVGFGVRLARGEPEADHRILPVPHDIAGCVGVR